ncbi:MAG: hypothetical protein ACLGIY_24435 [Betaproteobacteria bacterium]
MGWSSASSIMDAVIESVSANVSDEAARQAIYEPIIEVLLDGDWDTEDECLGQDAAFDAALREVYEQQGRDTSMFDEDDED